MDQSSRCCAYQNGNAVDIRSLAQTYRFADAFHHLVRDFISASRAFFQNVVDVRFIGQDFFAAFAHWREIFPKFLENLFLEIAVAVPPFRNCSRIAAISSLDATSE